MALRGRKPVAEVIRLATGNPGKRPIRSGPDAPGALVRPAKIRGRAAELWDEVAERAPWLSAADSYKLHVWCELQAEFERAPRKMVAARIGQLRSAGSELGLDPGSRARLGKGNDGAAPQDPSAKYFA